MRTSIVPRKLLVGLGSLFLLGAIVGVFVFLSGEGRGTADLSSQLDQKDIYTSTVQPIFDRRCAVCHSCYNASCQLNLTSYEGLMRGGTNHLLFDPMRSAEVPPTRLGIDAKDTTRWRMMGFHSVTDQVGAGRGSSILETLVELRIQNPHVTPLIPPEESQVCPGDGPELAEFVRNRSDAGMPYGLPPLTAAENNAIRNWIAMGAPEPRFRVPVVPSGLRELEAFLNKTDLRTKLVARYLYEHLFLAHLNVEGDRTRSFYRLVRSRSACEAGVSEIATRRPTDNPGTDAFWYCVKPLQQTIAEKTHLVYTISHQKLERWQQNFFGSEWTVDKLPSYDPVTSANPFLTFRALPARARYQWLLDNAEYTVMTFIKGPVCRGDTAVNVIDEQFWVLFLSPSADHFVTNERYAETVINYLGLPAARSREKGIINLKDRIVEYIAYHNRYRKARAVQFAHERPQGYALNDIWDGEGNNPNALLTVMRHYDSAYVTKGALGPIPKTAYVLDYPLFERIVYDLVVGYDVYGEFNHQALTRIYKHLIRMEAEENYLLFLPTKIREPLRNFWYRSKGVITPIAMGLVWPLMEETKTHPVAIPYQSKGPKNDRQTWDSAKAEFFSRVFTERFTPQVRGPVDSINCCDQSSMLEVSGQISNVGEFEQELKKIAARPARIAPYSRFLDDTMLLRLAVNGKDDAVFTLVRNKEHLNVAWIMNEDKRRDPDEDLMIAARGFVTSYPNRFLVVPIAKASSFLTELSNIRDEQSFNQWLSRYAISRTNPDFWRHSDWFNKRYRELEPITSGLLDLNRYELNND